MFQEASASPIKEKLPRLLLHRSRKQDCWSPRARLGLRVLGARVERRMKDSLSPQEGLRRQWGKGKSIAQSHGVLRVRGSCGQHSWRQSLLFYLLQSSQLELHLHPHRCHFQRKLFFLQPHRATFLIQQSDILPTWILRILWRTMYLLMTHPVRKPAR